MLLDQTATSSSMERVDDTSDADIRSPARALFIVTSSSAVAPSARLSMSHDISAANPAALTAAAEAYRSARQV